MPRTMMSNSSTGDCACCCEAEAAIEDAQRAGVGGDLSALDALLLLARERAVVLVVVRKAIMLP